MHLHPGSFIENVAYALNGESLDYLVCTAHGTRSLCQYPENPGIISGSKSSRKCEDHADDRTVFRCRSGRQEDCSKRRRYTGTWKPYASFCNGTDGTLAGGYGLLRSFEKILFSADAFGTFGALNGNLFNDDVDFEKDWIDDARRYFTNIVGKYGMQVQTLLKKAAGLDIQMICSLHGPVWRSNLNYFIEKHDKWSKYEPEEQAVAIIYGSIYGNTEQAADALAAKLGAKGVKNIAVYDASKTDVSELIAEIFRVSHLVIACPTYNGGIYPPIENLLAHMKALAVQNRTVAVMDNGTWAATAGKQIVKQLEEMKNMTVLDQKLSVKSTLKADQEENLDAFAQQIIDAM